MLAIDLATRHSPAVWCRPFGEARPLDRLFIISAGEITKQAKEWLVGQLDAGQRRHIIFMDRGEFLDHAARILLDLQMEEPDTLSDDDIPF